MSWRDWIRTVEIEPALSAADPSLLDGQVEGLLRAGCRIFHLDVDEGGYGLIESLAPLVHRYDGILDVHLAGGASVLEAVLRGADSVTVDPLGRDAEAASGVARGQGRQFGIVFPESQPEGGLALDASAVDLVSVVVDDTTASLAQVREIASDLPAGVFLQVEGDVNHDNVRAFRAVGATVFVVGRPLFEREDLPRTYRRLVQALA